MKFLKLIPILFIFFGNVPYKNEVHAEIKNPEDFRVLSNESKKLSISNVEYFIKEGDKYIKSGDFEKAKDFYLDARKLAKQLASFYSDLNSSFKGIDARIPNEMQSKGKQILKNGFPIPINSSIILAPTHRSRWDGLILTMAMGRRVTKKDCRFMVTKSEMRGIQGWFLKRPVSYTHLTLPTTEAV